MLDGSSRDSVVLHVTDELPGNFLKYLLSEVTTADSVVEAHKLDNIALSHFSLVTQTTTIAIKLLHGIEISITDANNNDRAWQLSQSDDLVNGLIHVMNGTICEDKQNRIDVFTDNGLSVHTELSKERLEVGRA